MAYWSTDDFPERDRFAVWREWRASHIFGVTADLPRDDRRGFQASIASRSIGKATLVDLRSTAYRARRTWNDIERVQSDSLCIYQQIAGPAWSVDDAHNERFTAVGCHIAVGYSDLPYETTPLAPSTFQTRLVKVPLARSDDPQGHRTDMRPRVLGQTPGLEALLQAYAQSFFREVDQLSDAAAQIAIETLTRLALLAHEGSNRASQIDGSSAAVAAGQLHLAKAFVRDNLHRANLSAETVARTLGVSPRQLHRIFRPSGTTFARYVLQARLDRVAALLASDPKTAVLDSALAAGFTATSVFYRAFRSRYGMAPRDYRMSVQKPGT